jgi:YidC/Oxa1 family membrane protein insertase
MRILKPELDEIKERTGDDMQKAQQEQMKLYKQAGVSPLGGCLPQLVQMPILFAMFRFFPASIELRQEGLWWADDLSTYDSIYNLGFEIPFYGDHVSLFTLLMTAVTILYTYMNSQNSGQMVGPMKSIMYIMPIMFLGFFNNYAAALSFYYFLSTCITVIQNFVIRKFVIDEDKLRKQIDESKKKKVKVSKKSGLQKRLEDMAKKRGIDPYKGKPKSKSPNSGKKPKK